MENEKVPINDKHTSRDNMPGAKSQNGKPKKSEPKVNDSLKVPDLKSKINEFTSIYTGDPDSRKYEIGTGWTLSKKILSADDLKLNVFSETGFLYSICRQDVDGYLDKELSSFRKAFVLLEGLLCKHSKLVAHRDAGFFPEDIISMTKSKFPKSIQEQERYNFAVEKLNGQIDSLQTKLSTPENTALVGRFNDSDEECLKWFNAPTTKEKAYRSPGWKTYLDLRESFDLVGRGDVVLHFISRTSDIRRYHSDSIKRRIVESSDRQYQKTLKSFEGKVCKIRAPDNSAEPNEKKDEDVPDSSSRRSMRLWDRVMEKFRGD